MALLTCASSVALQCCYCSAAGTGTRRTWDADRLADCRQLLQANHLCKEADKQQHEEGSASGDGRRKYEHHELSACRSTTAPRCSAAATKHHTWLAGCSAGSGCLHLVPLTSTPSLTRLLCACWEHSPCPQVVRPVQLGLYCLHTAVHMHRGQTGT